MSILAPEPRTAPLPPNAAASCSYNAPVTPPTLSPAMSSDGTSLPTPPSSIQKYRDALRRDLTARYHAAALAGMNAKVPADAAHDPDYGYDENPFDTRARLLLSFTDSSHAPSMVPPHVSPPTPPRRKRTIESPPPDDNGWVAVLDSPAPSIRSTRRRWSYASRGGGAGGDDSGLVSAAMSRSSSFSCCDTPGSETSFEIGRASDYIGLYGRPTLRVHGSAKSPARTPPPPPPPPIVSSSSSHGHSVFNPSPLAVSSSPFGIASSTPAREGTAPRRDSVLARSTPLKPLTQLTPSPQPRRTRRRVSQCPDPEWSDFTLPRSESETMLLAAAGFASQRSRAGRAV